MATNKAKLLRLLGEFSTIARRLSEPFNSGLAAQEALYRGVVNSIMEEVEESFNATTDATPTVTATDVELKGTLHGKLFQMRQIVENLAAPFKSQLVPIDLAMQGILNRIFPPKTEYPAFEDIIGVNIGKYVDHFTKDEQARGLSEFLSYDSFIDRGGYEEIPKPVVQNEDDTIPEEDVTDKDENGIVDSIIKNVRAFLLMEDIFSIKYKVLDNNGEEQNRRYITTPVSHKRAKAQFRLRKQNPAPLRDNKLQLEQNPVELPEDALSKEDMDDWKNRLRRMKLLGMHIRVSPEMLTTVGGIKRGFPDKWYRAEEWGCTPEAIQANATHFMTTFLEACDASEDDDVDSDYYFDMFEIGNEPWGQPGVKAYRAIAAGIIEACIKKFGNNVTTWPITLTHAAFQIDHEQHQLTRNSAKYHNIYVSDNVKVMTEGTFILSKDNGGTEHKYADFIKELNIHLYPFDASQYHESPEYFNYEYNEKDIWNRKWLDEQPSRAATAVVAREEAYARLRAQNPHFSPEQFADWPLERSEPDFFEIPIDIVKSNSLENREPESPASESEFASYKPFAQYADNNNLAWSVTEFGWTTGLDVVSIVNEKGEDKNRRILRMGIGGIAQAAYMFRAILILARHKVSKAYIYQSVDESGLGNFHSSGIFTIFLGDYGAKKPAKLGTRKADRGKPGYKELYNFLRKHGKKRFFEALAEDRGGTYAYLIGETKPTHLVTWHAIRADIDNQTQQQQANHRVESKELHINVGDYDFRTKVPIGLIPEVYDLEDLSRGTVGDLD